MTTLSVPSGDSDPKLEGIRRFPKTWDEFDKYCEDLKRAVDIMAPMLHDEGSWLSRTKGVKYDKKALATGMIYVRDLMESILADTPAAGTFRDDTGHPIDHKVWLLLSTCLFKSPHVAMEYYEEGMGLTKEDTMALVRKAFKKEQLAKDEKAYVDVYIGRLNFLYANSIHKRTCPEPFFNPDPKGTGLVHENRMKEFVRIYNEILPKTLEQMAKAAVEVFEPSPSLTKPPTQIPPR